MITNPIRFFHKDAGLRVEAVEAVETPELLCGGVEDPCKCALFNKECRGICFEVADVLGCNVYFKEVEDENR
jgi:hypothetical protein